MCVCPYVCQDDDDNNNNHKNNLHVDNKDDGGKENSMEMFQLFSNNDILKAYANRGKYFEINHDK